MLMNLTYPSDAQVVRQVMGGRRDSFRILVERYANAIQASALARLGNWADAQDAAQETFLKAFQSLHTLREPAKFGSWLRSIAQNVTSNTLRERQKSAELRDELSSGVERVTSPEMDRGELRTLLHQEIMQLEESPREVLLLYYYAGRNTRDIARMMDLTPNAVKKRLQRARQALSTRLTQDLTDLLRGDRPSRDTSAIMASLLQVASPSTETAAAAQAVGVALGAWKVAAGLVIVLGALGVVAWQVATHRTPANVSTEVAANYAAGNVTAAVQGGERTNVVSDAVTSAGGAANSTLASAPNEAPESDPPPDNVGPLAMSSISGVVLTNEGQPVSGARVKASGSINAAIMSDPRRRFGLGKTTVTVDEVLASPYTAETQADARGAFTFPELPYTKYWLEALPPNLEHLPDWTQAAARTSVTLAEGEHLKGVQLTFDTGQAIWGRVVDEEGAAVPDARVSALQVRPVGFNAWVTGVVNADGSYLVDGLMESADDVKVQVSAEGYLTFEDKMVPLETEANFTLVRAPHVAGRVVSESLNEPVTRFAIRRLVEWEVQSDVDRQVSNMEMDNGFPHEDPEGRFSFFLDRLGDNVIAIVTEKGEKGYVRLDGVTAGEQIVDIEIRVHPDLSEKIAIDGMVVDGNGAPVAGAWVFVREPSPMVSEYPSAFAQTQLDGQADAKTGADGTFQLSGLGPPVHTLAAFHPDFAIGWYREVLVPGKISTATIVMHKGGTVKGVVTLDGRPLELDDAHVRSSYGVARLDENGAYSLSPLSPGTNEIRCYLDREEFEAPNVEQWLQVLVEIENETTFDQRFDFETYHGVAQGTVYQGEMPLPSARIEVWFTRSDGVEEHYRTHSDASARYRFEGLPEIPLEGRVNGVLFRFDFDPVATFDQDIVLEGGYG